MENKYFTPSIEDINVGYECEIFGQTTTKLIKNVGFHKVIVGLHMEVGQKVGINQIPNLIKKGWLKVPYLTKEQIEGDGWINITRYIDETKKQSLVQFPDFEFKVKTGSFRLYLKDLNSPSKGLIIEEYIIGTEDIWNLSKFIIRYKGECASINEFRTICKLLKIK